MTKIQDWADEKLRRLCGRITPGKRLAVLLTMFLFFSIASVYIFVSGIYNMGKNEGQHIEIEHRISPLILCLAKRMKPQGNRFKRVKTR